MKLLRTALISDRLTKRDHRRKGDKEISGQVLVGVVLQPAVRGLLMMQPVRTGAAAKILS